MCVHIYVNETSFLYMIFFCICLSNCFHAYDTGFLVFFVNN